MNTSIRDVLLFSHSQSETWHKCPLAWRHQKIDHFPQAPAEALILGDAAHQAFEGDGTAWIARREHLGLDELRRIAGDAIRARVAAEDKHGLLDGNLLGIYERLDMALRTYIEHVQPGYEPVLVEKKIDRAIDATLRFTGRVDAIRKVGDEFVIDDFKIVGKPWPPRVEDHKDQVAAYLWGAEMLVERPPARMRFVVICGDTVEFRETARTGAQLAAYVNGVCTTAEQIREAKATDEFPARPSPLCGWCGSLGCCATGQTWLKDKGREPAVPMLGPDGAVVEWKDVIG